MHKFNASSTFFLIFFIRFFLDSYKMLLLQRPSISLVFLSPSSSNPDFLPIIIIQRTPRSSFFFNLSADSLKLEEARRRRAHKLV